MTHGDPRGATKEMIPLLHWRRQAEQRPSMKAARPQRRDAVIIRLPVRSREDCQPVARPVVSAEATLPQNTLILFPFGAVTRSERQNDRRRSTAIEIRQVHRFEQRHPQATAPADWEAERS